MNATVKYIDIVESAIQPTIHILEEFTHIYPTGIRVFSATSHLRTTEPMRVFEVGIPCRQSIRISPIQIVP